MTTPFRQRNVWQAALVALAVLFVLAGICAAGELDLTGVWRNDAGDTIAMRQDGREVWWYAKSVVKNDWTHVFHGKLYGKQIKGAFADVPPGGHRGSGPTTVDLIFKNNQVVGLSGPVGNNWRRVKGK